jgi:hypothetical protein
MAKPGQVGPNPGQVASDFDMAGAKLGRSPATGLKLARFRPQMRKAWLAPGAFGLVLEGLNLVLEGLGWKIPAFTQ